MGRVSSHVVWMWRTLAQVSPGGTYGGAYQFDRQTWQSVGGSGNPAAASPAEQDARASQLLSQRGSNPWPNCG